MSSFPSKSITIEIDSNKVVHIPDGNYVLVSSNTFEGAIKVILCSVVPIPSLPLVKDWKLPTTEDHIATVDKSADSLARGIAKPLHKLI